MREFVDDLHSVLVGLNLRMGLGPVDATRSARDAVRIVTQTYGGQRIYVPIPDEARSARDEQIARLRGQGLTIRVLARRFALSRSQVHAICARKGVGVRSFASKTGQEPGTVAATPANPYGADHA